MNAIPIKKKASSAHTDVFCGDSVYFIHPELGAQCADVISVGRDGVSVSHNGGEHGVLWEHLLGHKTRRARKLTLLDRGEDGGIAKDEEGKNVFIEGEIPIEDAELNKAETPPLPLFPPFDPSLDKTVSVLPLRDRAAIDAALIGAGFEPSLEYIRTTYGDHWRRPLPAVVDVDPLVKSMAEIKAEGEAAIDDLRTEFSRQIAALKDGPANG